MLVKNNKNLLIFNNFFLQHGAMVDPLISSSELGGGGGQFSIIRLFYFIGQNVSEVQKGEQVTYFIESKFFNYIFHESLIKRFVMLGN